MLFYHINIYLLSYYGQLLALKYVTLPSYAFSADNYLLPIYTVFFPDSVSYFYIIRNNTTLAVQLYKVFFKEF